MRTIFTALVLGLLCTNLTVAQDEPTIAAPEASTSVLADSVVVTDHAEVVAAESSPVVVTQVCVSGVCAARQPVKNLVVRPVASVLHNTASLIHQQACRTHQRMQQFRQCRTRLITGCCR